MQKPCAIRVIVSEQCQEAADRADACRILFSRAHPAFKCFRGTGLLRQRRAGQLPDQIGERV